MESRISVSLSWGFDDLAVCESFVLIKLLPFALGLANNKQSSVWTLVVPILWSVNHSMHTQHEEMFDNVYPGIMSQNN